jgi:thiamine biosynthesis lipoprotein
MYLPNWIAEGSPGGRTKPSRRQAGGLVARIAGLGLACLALAACASTAHRYEFSQPKMGTTVGLILYAHDEKTARAAAAAAFDRIDQLNSILSDYLDDSQITRLSATAGSGRAVPLSRDLFDVLAAAQEIHAWSDGAFDVTVGPAVRLWRRARRQNELPDPDRIRQALASVGAQHLRLDPARRTAELRAPGMLLDVGGIAKGYTASQVLALLRQSGIPRALVAMSGDVAAGEAPPNQPGWKVALDPMIGAVGQDAESSRSPHRRVLRLTNAAVSTSGDAFQHVEIGGVRYSHIVDPKTGLGLTRSIAVSVVASDATAADGLASAMCVMGGDRALRLADALPGVAAIVTERLPDGSMRVRHSRRAAQLPLDD